MPEWGAGKRYREAHAATAAREDEAAAQVASARVIALENAPVLDFEQPIEGSFQEQTTEEIFASLDGLQSSRIKALRIKSALARDTRYTVFRSTPASNPQQRGAGLFQDIIILSGEAVVTGYSIDLHPKVREGYAGFRERLNIPQGSTATLTSIDGGATLTLHAPVVAPTA